MKKTYKNEKRQFFFMEMQEHQITEYTRSIISKILILILIMGWRGFSGNEGKPTEEGLQIDGRSAVNWIINKGVKEENIL